MMQVVLGGITTSVAQPSSAFEYLYCSSGTPQHGSPITIAYRLAELGSCASAEAASRRSATHGMPKRSLRKDFTPPSPLRLDVRLRFLALLDSFPKRAAASRVSQRRAIKMRRKDKKCRSRSRNDAVTRVPFAPASVACAPSVVQVAAGDAATIRHSILQGGASTTPSPDERLRGVRIARARRRRTPLLPAAGDRITFEAGVPSILE